MDEKIKQTENTPLYIRQLKNLKKKLICTDAKDIKLNIPEDRLCRNLTSSRLALWFSVEKLKGLIQSPPKILKG